MKIHELRAAALVVFGLLSSCVGTTGGELVTFDAMAVGAAETQPGQPLQFESDRGWNVLLTEAKLRIGAIYLNHSMPVSGVQNTSCILPGTYVGQVTSGLDVDLLSPELQPFPARGEGATQPSAAVAQVWLTGARIDRAEDTTPILRIAGTAQKDGVAKPFTGTITIGSNRVLTSSDATQAGAAPICKQRIVTPIPVAVSLQESGHLLLRIDPRRLFTNVDFALLPPLGNGFAFSDDVNRKDQPSVNLYNNLRSAGSLYSFEWVP
jgi:hypothetical protein